MSNHFIKNIEIKNFKCFEDFKAEGFGRVNLIGGKNNVGKTAFLEACYFNVNSNISFAFHLMIFNRYKEHFLVKLMNHTDKKYIFDFVQNEQKKYKNSKILSNLKEQVIQYSIPFEEKDATSLFLWDGDDSSNLEKLYAYILEAGLEDKVDKYLNEFDSSINSFRIINSTAKCKKNDNIFYNISEFGDGLRSYLTTILALFSSKQYIFIDEVDNGIHHTKLDKLWNIILTIAKEQNVQVFATTHSKECIKALVIANTEDVKTYQAKEQILDNDEIKFIELGRTDGKIDSIVFDFDELKNEVEQNMEIRGW